MISLGAGEFMLSKFMYLAPVAFTTAGVMALISIKLDDPKTKKILRGIALILAIGAGVSLFQQLAELAEVAARAQRNVAEQSRLIEEERAKAADAARKAKEAEEAARLAHEKAEAEVKRIRLEAEEHERRAAAKRQRDEQALREALAKAAAEQRAREEREARRRREVMARELAAKEEADRQKKAQAQQARARLTEIVRADRCKAVSVCPPGGIFSLSRGECIPIQYYGGVIPGSEDDQTFVPGRGWVPNCPR
jgi:hypothetical protein